MPTEPTWEETTAIDEPTWETTTETQETQSPGFLGPSWPSGEGEGESIAEPDPERERKKADLANQMRLARAERGLSDVIESFIGGAARAVEPLTPSGLMNQPTRIAGAITGKAIPDIYQPGKPLINVPQPSGTGVIAGLGQLGAQTLSGLTTPEMIVTGPALPVSSAARAIMAGEMAAGLPESIARGGEVLRSPEATIAEKVVATGQPIITAAMVRGLGQTGKWLPEAERTIAKAEPILPQAAQAAREAQATVTSPQVSEFDAITARLEEQERQRAAAVMRGDVTDPLSMLSPLQRKVLGQYDLGVFKEMARFANEGLLTRENFLRRINEAIAIQKRNKTPIDISVQKGETYATEERNVAESVSGERQGNDALGTPTETGSSGSLQPATPITEAQAPNAAQESGRVLLTPEERLAEQRAPDEALGQETEVNLPPAKLTPAEAAAAKAVGLKIVEPPSRKNRTIDIEPTPLLEATPTVPPAAEPSQLTPAKQGSKLEPISKATTPLKESQVGNAPTPSAPSENLIISPRTDGFVMLQDTARNTLGTFKNADEAAAWAKDNGYGIAAGSPLKPTSPAKTASSYGAETVNKLRLLGLTKKEIATLEKGTSVEDVITEKLPVDLTRGEDHAAANSEARQQAIKDVHLILESEPAFVPIGAEINGWKKTIRGWRKITDVGELGTTANTRTAQKLESLARAQQPTSTTTPSQITQAPFLDIPPEKWTPEYWKRIGDEGRRTVRGNLQGALQKIGSKTKVTERSSPQAVFNAIAEVNKARSETPPQPPLPPGPGAKTVGEPPYAAAQQLTDQLRATKPTGTKDTYTVRQKLADAWAEGKSVFDRALASSRVTAEGLKDTARGVRAITDLDRRIGELDWLLQKSAAQSRNMGKAIEQQQKSKVTREAVALWIDAGGNEQLLRDTLANLPAKTKPSIRHALEVAANLPPEAKQFAQQIEQFYGIRLQDAQQAEIFSKSLDDYFTHIWKKESNMPEKLRAAYSTGRVNDYFQFARQRKLPMFLDGILQGKVPELDPAKVVPYYNYALDRSIASRQFVKELSEVNAPDGRPAVLPTGTARKIEPNEEGGQGGIFINPKGKGELGKDYHVIDHPAMRKWKWLGADENGNPVMYRSDLAANPLVHERLARMLDQRLATPSKVGKQLLRASTEVKGFKLGLLSAFHQVHVGSHALFHWTNPFKTGDIDWESPATKYAVEKGHLKLAGDAAQIANFSEGLLSPGLVHKVPIVGPWSKAYSEWLFTDWIPRLKLKTFENALPRNLAWFAKDIKAGKITPEQVAARVGDSVNNAYGELNHWFLGKSGRSPQFQRILRGIFLAPDFGEARLRFVEKAFTKYGWEERMALATMFMTLYTGARVANWLSHGDPETDLKNAFRVKVKLPGKEQMEWMSMRSVVGDLAHALTGFGQFMYVRLNPLYSRTISDVLFQRDVYGRKLSFGDIAFKRPAQQLVPINLTGLTREDQSLWESAITSAGLQVQHDVPAMDIGKLKRQWLLASEDPKLRTIGEHGEASIYPPSDYAPLRRALASGDLEKAGAEYDALIKDKGKKRADIVDALSWYSGGKEVNGVYRERKVKPIGGQIGAEAEKKFIASLNPAEKRLYQQAMDERKRIYQKFLELLKSR